MQGIGFAIMGVVARLLGRVKPERDDMANDDGHDVTYSEARGLDLDQPLLDEWTALHPFIGETHTVSMGRRTDHALLSEAWAEVEAVLPESWSILALECDGLTWGGAAGEYDVRSVTSYGDTAVEALRDLAAALRSYGVVIPARESDVELQRDPRPDELVRP